MTAPVRPHDAAPRWLSALLAIVACAIGCASRTSDRAPEAAPRAGAPVAFGYQRVGGRSAVDSDALRGRAALITFVTTYDLASQAQVRFLTGVVRRHVPRINALGVVLEPVANAPLVEAFGDALNLPFPLAWGDPDTIAGRGPFGDVHAVPTTVLLDRRGRLVWKHVGLAKEDELTAALDAL